MTARTSWVSGLDGGPTARVSGLDLRRYRFDLSHFVYVMNSSSRQMNTTLQSCLIDRDSIY